MYARPTQNRSNIGDKHASGLDQD